MTHDVTSTVRDWLRDSAAEIADPVDLYPAVASTVHQTPQQHDRSVSILARRSPRTTLASLVATGAAFVLIGGLLFAAGSDGGSSREAAPVGAGPSESAGPLASDVASADPATIDGPIATRRSAGGLDDDPRHEVEFEAALVLPGQVQTATARICLGDTCYPATEARWVVGAKKYRDLIKPRRGANVRVTAKDKIGGMEINVKGRWGKVPGRGYLGASYTTGITVRPLPGESTLDWRRRHGGHSWVFPDEQVLRVGQYVVLTGWTCATGDGDGYGEDRRPGTADDECSVSPIISADPLSGSGMTLVGRFGPSALMRVDRFIDLGGDLNAAGVFIRYAGARSDDVEIPFLYVRDERWQGPLLGDVDADGRVDSDDREAISAALGSAEGARGITFGAAAWVDALDLNDDRRIDEVDLQLSGALIERHAGPIDTP